MRRTSLVAIVLCLAAGSLGAASVLDHDGVPQLDRIPLPSPTQWKRSSYRRVTRSRRILAVIGKGCSAWSAR